MGDPGETGTGDVMVANESVAEVKPQKQVGKHAGNRFWNFTNTLAFNLEPKKMRSS